MSNDPALPRAELRAAAEQTLDALDNWDYRRVQAKFHTRDELVMAMCDGAEDIARRGRPVPPEQYPLLTAATLTFGAQHCGVQQNPRHARARFETLRRHPDVPIGIVVLLRNGDDLDTGRRLATAHHVERALAAHGRPKLDKTMVAAAVATCVTTDVDDAVELARTVLDRTDALVLAYRSSGRPVPPLVGGTLGNPDFLLLVAAMGAALPHAVAPGSDPLEVMAKSVEGAARGWADAAGPDHRHGQTDGADITRFFRASMQIIAGVPGRRIFDRLSRDVAAMQLRPDERTVSMDPADLMAVSPDADPAAVAADVVDGASEEVERLTGWVAAALYTRASGPLRAALDRWLRGERRPNDQTDLAELTERVRMAERVLLARPAGQPPQSADPTVLAALRARFAGAAEHAGGGAAAVLAAALPPLWTRRRPVINAFAAAIALQAGALGRESTATVVAAVLARGPGQIAYGGRGEAHAPTPGCTRADGLRPRCSARHRTTTAPAPDRFCSARPWGEPGFVESYDTLAALATLDSWDAARKRLDRYAGRNGLWAERIRLTH